MRQWYDPRQAYQIQPIPWLSEETIAWLSQIIEPEFEIVEFGGGGSTLWFAEQVKSVYCYENNLDWFNAISNAGMKNIHMRFADLPIEGEEAGKDMLVIDGEPLQNRGAWLNEAGRLVKRGGWVVLDNANRPEYASERARFSKIARLLFSSDIVMKHLITEVWRIN